MGHRSEEQLLEIEAKFSVPDRLTFQRLLEAQSIGGLTLGEGSVTHIQDRYLDTVEGALRAQGYACRLRQQNGRVLASLKGLGSAEGLVHRRQELEVALPRPLPPAEWPPGTARDLAVRLSGARPLLPLLAISQIRHSRPVLVAGSTLATLSLDDISVRHDEWLLASFLELEAELLPGQAEEELERLAQLIVADWALVPQSQSKFERALALLQAVTSGEPLRLRRLSAEERAVVDRMAEQPEVLARRARLLQAWDDGLSRQEMAACAGLSPRRVRHWLSTFRQERLGVFPPSALRAAWPERQQERAAAARDRSRRKRGPGLVPGDTMGRAAVKVVGFHYRRMLFHEPGTRLGHDVEALHDMRVATRRMRAALRVFEASFEPETRARLAKGLRDAGRALGPVRDLDVFRQKTWTYQESLPEEQRAGLAEFLRVVEDRREAARIRMTAYLDGRKYARFKADMQRFLTGDGKDGVPGSSDKVRDVAPVTVQERLAAVLAFDPEVNCPDPSPERLHDLRITCKRLRYTLEFFEEVLGPQTHTLLLGIVALQDHLGALQDAVVAGQIIGDYLAVGTWRTQPADPLPTGRPPQAPGVEAYLASNQAEMQHLLATFAPAWQRISGPEFGRLVAGAIAAL